MFLITFVEVDIHVDGGLSLAFALWKRSDVLLELKEYARALSDLQLALKEGLPAKHKAELYWKMARCYMGMGELKKAEVSYTLAEKLETDNDKKTVLKKEIQEKSNIDQNLKKPGKYLALINKFCLKYTKINSIKSTLKK